MNNVEDIKKKLDDIDILAYIQLDRDIKFKYATHKYDIFDLIDILESIKKCDENSATKCYECINIIKQKYFNKQKKRS